MKPTRYAAALALCLAAGSLGGCKTIESAARDLTGSDTYEDFSGRFITIAKERQTPRGQDNLVTTLGEAVGGRKGGADYTFGLGGKVTAGEASVSSGGQGGAALEAYMAGILARIVAEWPHERPEIRVALVDDATYSAGSTADGSVRVAQGFLIHCESEDELAFALAHEVSHILLRHHEAVRHKNAQRELESATAAVLAMALSKKDPSIKNQRDLNMNAWLATQGYSTLRWRLLDPAWDRAQEDEADLLALDLVTAAGYNNSAYQTVLERLADAETAKLAREEAEHKAIEAQITGAMETDPGAGFNMALGRMAQGPMVIVGKIFEEAGKAHASADGRRRNLDGYFVREIDELQDGAGREYKTAAYEKATQKGAGGKLLVKRIAAGRARAMLAEGRDADADKLLTASLDGATDTDPEVRLMLHDLRKKQGRDADARANLAAALKNPAAPRPVHATLVADRRDAQDWKGAIDALNRMDARFRSRKENLPLRLDLMLRSGQTKPAEAVARECMATRNPELVRACQATSAAYRKGDIRT